MKNKRIRVKVCTASLLAEALDTRNRHFENINEIAAGLGLGEVYNIEQAAGIIAKSDRADDWIRSTKLIKKLDRLINAVPSHRFLNLPEELVNQFKGWGLSI